MVQILGDYTGHIPGADMVCGIFPKTPAANYVEQGRGRLPQLCRLDQVQAADPGCRDLFGSAWRLWKCSPIGGIVELHRARFLPATGFGDLGNRLSGL